MDNYAEYSYWSGRWAIGNLTYRVELRYLNQNSLAFVQLDLKLINRLFAVIKWKSYDHRKVIEILSHRLPVNKDLYSYRSKIVSGFVFVLVSPAIGRAII